MDNFDQYIKENRLRLDSEDLETSGWERIEKAFRQYDRRRTLRRFCAVSGLTVIILIGTFLLLPESNNYDSQTAILDGVESQYLKEEMSSIKMIRVTEDQIRKQSIPAEYEDMFIDFIKQLQIIDKQNEIYITEISEHGYTRELIQQVIYSYQLKLSVLQQLQSEINKINTLTKDKKNENKKIRLPI